MRLILVVELVLLTTFILIGWLRSIERELLRRPLLPGGGSEEKQRQTQAPIAKFGVPGVRRQFISTRRLP